MTANVAALGLTAAISIIVPLILFGIVIRKNPMERIGVLLAFVAGVVIYLLMEWGVKEQGLKLLFEHKSFSDFVNQHYIPYLFLIAFAGAVLAVIPEFLVVLLFFKNQMSFMKATMLGLGYGMAEAVMLVGYRSIFTLIELLKNSETELNTTTLELFLSAYERVLMMVIHVAVVVGFIYFVEQKMEIRGSVIAILCLTLASFLPGCFIAFSLKNYYEVYDRSVALVLVYVVLTMGAVCGAIILNSLKYSLKDERIDSKQAVAAYYKKLEENREKKEQKRKNTTDR